MGPLTPCNLMVLKFSKLISKDSHNQILDNVSLTFVEEKKDKTGKSKNKEK